MVRGLAPRVYYVEMPNVAKKRNFPDAEIEIILAKVQKNKLVLFGSLKSSMKSESSSMDGNHCCGQ